MRNKILNKKEHVLRAFYASLIVFVLLFSTIPVLAHTIDSVPQQLHTNEQIPYGYSDPFSISMGEDVFFEEDFENNESIPPTSPMWGPWKNTTISDQTWYIDYTDPEDGLNCTTVRRGEYTGLMDERLITPSIDFSGKTKIRLLFSWYTSDLAAIHLNRMDLNVSITNDSENTWTWLWNENNEASYWSYTWEQCEIDLSKYAAGKSDVRLCFQFHSWNTSNASYQEYSIDSMTILTNSTTDFWCDAGPNETISWPFNDNHGIQFIGKAGGGKQPYRNWSWDFGDGYKAKLRDVKHRYDTEGIYHVILSVRDNANPPHIAYSYKTLNVWEIPPGNITLKIKSPSLGRIKVEVNNIGELNITQISWEIKVEGGLIIKFKDTVGNGNISYLDSHKITTITSNQLLFHGQGFITITVTAMPLNADWAMEVRNAFKIGPFLLVFPE